MGTTAYYKDAYHCAVSNTEPNLVVEHPEMYLYAVRVGSEQIPGGSLYRSAQSSVLRFSGFGIKGCLTVQLDDSLGNAAVYTVPLPLPVDVLLARRSRFEPPPVWFGNYAAKKAVER